MDTGTSFILLNAFCHMYAACQEQAETGSTMRRLRKKRRSKLPDETRFRDTLVENPDGITSSYERSLRN